MRRLPPDATGTVVLGNTAPGLAGFDDRADGIRGRFAEKLPGVVVLGPFDTQRDDAANRDAWKRLVAANPDALAFVGTGDCDGVSLAALKTEKSARWLVGGFGVDPRTLQAVRDGAMVATISPEHYLKGAVAGWLLAQAREGRRDAAGGLDRDARADGDHREPGPDPAPAGVGEGAQGLLPASDRQLRRGSGELGATVGAGTVSFWEGRATARVATARADGRAARRWRACRCGAASARRTRPRTCGSSTRPASGGARVLEHVEVADNALRDLQLSRTEQTVQPLENSARLRARRSGVAAHQRHPVRRRRGVPAAAVLRPDRRTSCAR